MRKSTHYRQNLSPRKRRKRGGEGRSTMAMAMSNQVRAQVVALVAGLTRRTRMSPIATWPARVSFKTTVATVIASIGSSPGRKPEITKPWLTFKRTWLAMRAPRGYQMSHLQRRSRMRIIDSPVTLPAKTLATN